MNDLFKKKLVQTTSLKISDGDGDAVKWLRLQYMIYSTNENLLI